MFDPSLMKIEKPQIKVGNNRAGDLIIKAGDGCEGGNGGNLTIIGGTYKAGDAN